jgi:hypothetical protein
MYYLFPDRRATYARIEKTYRAIIHLNIKKAIRTIEWLKFKYNLINYFPSEAIAALSNFKASAKISLVKSVPPA